jgi:site-specific DNA-cytosine methylase
MKILIACEESQTITKEYRKLGFEAYSCDVLDCSGGHPEWHIKGDAIKEAYSGKYDLMIAHPPCTYLAVSGNRWLYNKDKTKNKERWKNRELALDFVRKLMNAPIKKIAIENPVSCISSQIRKPDQIIQPYMFGDEAKKTTCLWLKNLPKLTPTNIVGKGDFKITKGGNKLPSWYNLPPSPMRSKIRSKTFKGIARAIAEQWQ